MAKSKNPYKQKLIDEFGDIEVLEFLWKDTMSLARRFIGGKRNKFKQKYSEVALYLAKEKLLQSRYGGASFYAYYQKAKGTEGERYEYALKQEYANRTKEFRRKYGDEKVEFNGKTKTINEWFKEFGKTISKNDMNDIIDIMKNNEEVGYKEFYNSNGQNGATQQENEV